MPLANKGPRLYWRKPTDNRAGTWVIRDGPRQIRTGCGESQIAEAERALATYLAQKHQPVRKQRRLDTIPIADVLIIYAEDVVPGLATAAKALARIETLNNWWGAMMLGEVTGASCRQFAAGMSPGAARRTLQDLQAAINHHHREGLHRESVLVWLPPAGKPRERWLTRTEVARLLRTCWHTKETQRGVETAKYPLRHLTRFVLFSLATTSRPGDVLNAAFVRDPARGYVDLDLNRFFRLPPDKAATKKRQPPIPLTSRIASHCRRWSRNQSFVVEFHGGPVLSVKVAWQRAVELAGLGDDVVPYTLRHTAITWAMLSGASIYDTAHFAGTSPEMIDRHYGHMHPDHLADVAHRIGHRLGHRLAQKTPGQRENIASSVKEIDE